MAEVFVQYSEPVTGSDGQIYMARACGAEMDDSRWEGWLEFVPADGGPAIRSARETTQPNRTDTAYWATGLTAVFLEGSLERALRPGPPAPSTRVAEPAFERPASRGGDGQAPPAESVLNPFSVYRKGEDLLRRQLSALAGWHLVNIVRAYDLSDRSVDALERATPTELIELIVASVRESGTKEA